MAAGDEARRRIERDLHDGTQQRLVSLALVARAAAAELPSDNGELRERLSRIAAGLGAAVEELQELSRGIHPSILTDAGLGAALESLALRSPIAVELAAMTRKRFPRPIEVAAYFVASESLANAAKHSQASRIDVALTLKNDLLQLSVCDNGIGGADPGQGSGLVGLRDRVDALGGSLEINSKAGEGTSVVVAFPSRNDRASRRTPLEPIPATLAKWRRAQPLGCMVALVTEQELISQAAEAAAIMEHASSVALPRGAVRP